MNAWMSQEVSKWFVNGLYIYIYNPLTNWVYWGYNPLTNYVQLPGTIKWGIWTKICTPKKNWFPHLSIILGNEIEIEIHWNSYIFVKQVFAIIFSYRSQPDRIFSIREISDPWCFLFGILFVDENPAGWPIGCYFHQLPPVFHRERRLNCIRFWPILWGRICIYHILLPTWVFPKMVGFPNLHPQVLIIFSRKTHGCWGNPPF